MNRYQHTGDLGDCIASLPTIRALGGGKLVLCAPYGPMQARESMKGKRFEVIRPLLESQPYISSVEWSDTPIKTKFDFSNFRHDHILGESLLDWQARHFGMEVSSDPWLSNITPRAGLSDRIIVARTERYQNWQFPWPAIVKAHRDRLLFIGLPSEHKAFTKLVGPVEYLPTEDMLEVAEVIAGSQLLIANQTAACWIGLGLGHPLIQEQSPVTRDSMIPRDNAQYCLYDAMPVIPSVNSSVISIAQKPKPDKNTTTMLAVLSYYDGDKEQARALAEHIRDLGGVDEHSCLLVFPEGTTADGIYEPLQQAFGQVDVMQYKATLNGWPQGPNEAFAVTAAHINRTPHLGDFTWLEPDCVPTTSRWLTTIANGHRNGGMPILGVSTDTVAMDTKQKIGRHVIGVAVYPKNFAQLCPLVKSVVNMSGEMVRQRAVPMAFDAYFGPYTVPRVCETRLIQHFWRSGDFERQGPAIVARKTVCPGAENVVSPEAVLLHGAKDASLLNIIRENLGLSGAPTPKPKILKEMAEMTAAVPLSKPPELKIPKAGDPFPKGLSGKQPKPEPSEFATVVQIDGVTQVPPLKRGQRHKPVAPQDWNRGTDGLVVVPFLPGQPEWKRYNALMIDALDPKGGFTKIRDYARKNLKINTFKMSRERICEACVIAERTSGKESWTKDVAPPWFPPQPTEETPEPTPEPEAPKAPVPTIPTYSATPPSIGPDDITQEMREKMIALRRGRGLPVGA